jgi:pimeloyl-ACP methyl ester carboxylesterase
MQRRTFLRAASASALMAGGMAKAQRTAASAVTSTGSASFTTAEIEVAANKIFVRRYGQGPGILMVHGFPRTSLMWRFLGQKLADTHTVVCVDLRAYGQSGIPASADDHLPYSKRAMAKELVEVMAKLDFPTFTLIGHDRGGRVSYRMALDHPKSVERLAVFDVIPILEAWNRSDARFAQTYWPWILLSQKQPLRRAICSALRKPSSITNSVRVLSAPRFSQNTFPPIAIQHEYMESARSIGPRRRSMSNTIGLTRKLRSASNARCCINGRGWSARHLLCKGRRSAGHLASMGSGRSRTGDERWALLPGREPG